MAETDDGMKRKTENSVKRKSHLARSRKKRDIRAQKRRSIFISNHFCFDKTISYFHSSDWKLKIFIWFCDRQNYFAYQKSILHKNAYYRNEEETR